MDANGLGLIHASYVCPIPPGKSSACRPSRLCGIPQGFLRAKTISLYMISPGGIRRSFGPLDRI